MTNPPIGEPTRDMYHAAAKDLVAKSEHNAALIIDELRSKPEQADMTIIGLLTLTQAMQSIAASLIADREDRRA